ncbi:multidrug ABC transporter permease [Corynebacterium alimapuense]|uniref:Multidrug ABC transporter permease n=1 Tax=Corynebacterium alimapuense TaxID=1576874 RepID=A0A3M8KAV3_9CORY|nr:multidrug ABC transporter permease [Corynebacterium alimapuense]RNE49915.1 multidrug ABC transporter permease [Corynebacterium alimapuense]
MFINTLVAEWTKLRTTRSFWWTTALFILMSLGWAGLTGYTSLEAQGDFPTLWAASSAVAVYLLGFSVIMIQSVMLVTTEYRYHLQSTSYLATPRRWTVALAKLLLYSAIAAALTFLMVLAGFYLARALAPESAAALFNPLEDAAALRILWSYPAMAASVVMLAQGVGLLLRQTAGSVALVLIWFMGLEQIFRLIPEFGSDIASYLPFQNLDAFIQEVDIAGLPWDHNGSGAYFLLWAAILWLLGVVVLQRRDA